MSHQDFTSYSLKLEASRLFLLSKRVVDIVGSLVLLFIFSPIIIACIIMIKLADPGPAIFSQWRVGKNGVLFRLYKLRSMYLNAESSNAVLAGQADARIIKICKWMRVSHVDELPQLWNIFKGEMSLIGPRPERPELIGVICDALPEFKNRLIVRPGLTGLAQVTSGYADTLEGMRVKLKYDLMYIRELNWRNELRLVLKTCPCVWDFSAH